MDGSSSVNRVTNPYCDRRATARDGEVRALDAFPPAARFVVTT
jgi:hypothetical protein